MGMVPMGLDPGDHQLALLKRRDHAECLRAGEPSQAMNGLAGLALGRPA